MNVRAVVLLLLSSALYACGPTAPACDPCEAMPGHEAVGQNAFDLERTHGKACTSGVVTSAPDSPLRFTWHVVPCDAESGWCHVNRSAACTPTEDKLVMMTDPYGIVTGVAMPGESEVGSLRLRLINNTRERATFRVEAGGAAAREGVEDVVEMVATERYEVPAAVTALIGSVVPVRVDAYPGGGLNHASVTVNIPIRNALKTCSFALAVPTDLATLTTHCWTDDVGASGPELMPASVKCDDPATPDCDMYPPDEDPLPTEDACVYAVITNSRSVPMSFRYWVSSERNGMWATHFSVDGVSISPGEAKTYGPTRVPAGDYTLLTLRARYADGTFFDQKGLAFYATGCPTGRFSIGDGGASSWW